MTTLDSRLVSVRISDVQELLSLLVDVVPADAATAAAVARGRIMCANIIANWAGRERDGFNAPPPPAAAPAKKKRGRPLGAATKKKSIADCKHEDVRVSVDGDKEKRWCVGCGKVFPAVPVQLENETLQKAAAAALAGKSVAQ